MEGTLPFSKEQIEEIASEYPTPFHIYDEKGIRENARRLTETFSWIPGFKEYFAVKACPNPFIMDILREEGFGADCSSLNELFIAEESDITGEEIMFTSNDTPVREFRKAAELGAIINLDDLSHIDFLAENVGMPELISFRYNPGPLREGNAIIGEPEEAKYGFMREQLDKGYLKARNMGVRRFGLHTMIASNELNPHYFVDTADMLFDVVLGVSDSLDIPLEFINIGGGMGIPYRLGEEPIDLSLISNGMKKLFSQKMEANGMGDLKIFMENGRMITGPYGYLVSRVLHLKDIYKKYVGLDACMANLMRPAIYGAYHHITVLGKEGEPHDKTYDVTGSLCENNDKFAIDRKLPKIERGDLLAIHDAGAHGYSMGFNYNGKMRSSELLLREDGSVEMIRREENSSDYFSTFRFTGSRHTFKNISY